MDSFRRRFQLWRDKLICSGSIRLSFLPNLFLKVFSCYTTGMPTGTYYVYIMASETGTLYVGMTNDLKRRVWQHKNKQVEGFTQKYNVNRLVYAESFGDVHAAIAREKQIKGFRREKKVALIDKDNLCWKDLSELWGKE